jgi:hypothetical protein
MSKRSRDSFETEHLSEISSSIDRIIELFTNKNIVCDKQIDIPNQNIKINILDNNSSDIGVIEGGVSEFTIIENGINIETNAFSISWVKINDKYKRLNLGSFLIIYCIYLCKINFPDIKYIVLDDDTGVTNVNDNIYYKLGFRYLYTKEVSTDNGEIAIVNTGPEMQLNINDFFFKNDISYKLVKIQSTIKNYLQLLGGKRIKTTRKVKKRRKSRKSRKTKKSKRRN